MQSQQEATHLPSNGLGGVRFYPRSDGLIQAQVKTGNSFYTVGCFPTEKEALDFLGSQEHVDKLREKIKEGKEYEKAGKGGIPAAGGVNPSAKALSSLMFRCSLDCEADPASDSHSSGIKEEPKSALPGSLLAAAQHSAAGPTDPKGYSLLEQLDRVKALQQEVDAKQPGDDKQRLQSILDDCRSALTKPVPNSAWLADCLVHDDIEKLLAQRPGGVASEAGGAQEGCGSGDKEEGGKEEGGGTSSESEGSADGGGFD